MSLTAAALTSAATLAGSYLGYLGNKAANEKNISAQKEANQLSIELSNTAHQREVADLRAAGLNPILSAGGSGASVPSLGAATVGSETEGIANAASSLGRELGRLASTQTRLQNESLQMANKEQKEYLNSGYFEQDAESSRKERLGDALAQHAKNHQMAALTEAYEDLYGDPKAWRNYVDLVRAGLVSSAKDSANSNWRNNISVLTGAGQSLSSSVNNAASAARQARLTKLLMRK